MTRWEKQQQLWEALHEAEIEISLKNVKDQEIWVLGRCSQCSSSARHFQGIGTNTGAPIKEKII